VYISVSIGRAVLRFEGEESKVLRNVDNSAYTWRLLSSRRKICISIEPQRRESLKSLLSDAAVCKDET
jgi:hypothetical protein